ncbi:MAG: EcsC family protein [Desulfamplus sp.]|nr:EcsC family protein [Desulfamplus sp.]
MPWIVSLLTRTVELCPHCLYFHSKKLIRWQIAKAGTSGFVTGLGGIITLPIAIPANIASVIYVQIRMIAAIAYMGGYDIHDDRVKSLVYLCLCGSAATDVIKGVGIQIGTKLSVSAINKISGATLTKINQAVGFRLLTKFGQTGAINLGKAVPIIGGVIGGTIDSITTKTIGKVATNTFIEKL